MDPNNTVPKPTLETISKLTTTTTTTTKKVKKEAVIHKNNNKGSKVKWITRKEAKALVIDSEIAIKDALVQLETVRELAAKAGLSVDCTTLPRNVITPSSSTVASSGSHGTITTSTVAVDPNSVHQTGGHSNTDHSISRTGNVKMDRLSELKRNLWRRHRAMQPENRGEERWDKPRLPGERRRRIVREMDTQDAPPEPNASGYVVFLSQMTLKIRHDRPNVPHDQAKVMQEISKLWQLGMSEEDREYYNVFAEEAKAEYSQQITQFRATGAYTPSTQFLRLPNVSVWVRRPETNKQNALEREICQYTHHVFPKRPPSMDVDYHNRQERSQLRRKLRLKGLMTRDGILKEGLDFEELLQQEREKMAKRERERAEKAARRRQQDTDNTKTVSDANSANQTIPSNAAENKESVNAQEKENLGSDENESDQEDDQNLEDDDALDNEEMDEDYIEDEEVKNETEEEGKEDDEDYIDNDHNNAESEDQEEEMSRDGEEKHSDEYGEDSVDSGK